VGAAELAYGCVELLRPLEVRDVTGAGDHDELRPGLVPGDDGELVGQGIELPGKGPRSASLARQPGLGGSRLEDVEAEALDRAERARALQRAGASRPASTGRAPRATSARAVSSPI
jgi:hypothetical protein